MPRTSGGIFGNWLPGARRLCLLIAALAFAAGTAGAETGKGAARKAFRVCKDTHNMPFTNAGGEGFEDRIAALFASELGLPVENYTFPQRRGFIRNTLRFKLPGGDYPCDIVMGVPAEFEQVLTTKPSYRSTYVLVLASGKGLDEVNSEADFLGLPRQRLAELKIGVFDHSPGADWLERHRLVDSGVFYRIMSANPDEHPGDIIEHDLAHGRLDAVVMWGPIAGYFARHAGDLRVIPLASQPGLRFDYVIAMGVRFGDKAWKHQIDDLIDKKRGEIDAILRDYGVPLLPLPPESAAAPRQVAR